MKILLSSEEVNVLIYRYLLENGFVHTAFSFSSEANLASNATWSAHGASLFPNALIAFLQKALLYLWIEYHTDDESGSDIPCSQAFAFFRRHECWYNSDAEGSVMRPALDGGVSGAVRGPPSQGNSGVGGASRRASSTGGGNTSTSGLGGTEHSTSHGHQLRTSDDRKLARSHRNASGVDGENSLTIRRSRRSSRPSSPRSESSDDEVKSNKALGTSDADVPIEYVTCRDVVKSNSGTAVVAGSVESSCNDAKSAVNRIPKVTAPTENQNFELVTSESIKESHETVKESRESVKERAKRASEPLLGSDDRTSLLPSSKRFKRSSSPNPSVEGGRCSSSVGKGVLSVKSSGTSQAACL
eukprot:Lankesteria_metandrocarpae@DN2305_c0_g1_i1.p1